jgi:pimeloyl-ACP methyl ester carboxylesterase
MQRERFVLLPGMGADERLFEPQRRAGLDFEVPALPVPGPRDTLADYAARIRDAIDLAGPCVVGGVSFGGMVACELARLCDARCVILVASCRNRAGIPSHYRMFELLSRVIPDALIRRRAAVSGRLFATLECITDEQRDVVMRMSRDVAVPQLRGIARMILGWHAPATYPCPIHHIHGNTDRIIPISRVQPDEIVGGGGHLINMTHAPQINAFIRRCLAPGIISPASPRTRHAKIPELTNEII